MAIHRPFNNLNALDSTFGFDAWSRLRNPDMFKIDYTDGTPEWDRSFVFPNIGQH